MGTTPFDCGSMTKRDLYALGVSVVAWFITEDISKAYFSGMSSLWLMCKLGWPVDATQPAPSQVVGVDTNTLLATLQTYLQQQGAISNGTQAT